MNRFHLILTALALIQIVLLVVFRWTGSDDALGSEPGSRAGERPFEKLQPEQVGKLQITDGDGRSVTIEKKGTEGQFVLASKGDYPLRADSSSKALERLPKLVLGRLVSRRPSAFVKLEVADTRFSRKVEVFDSSGKPLRTFFLGEGKNYDSVLYREAGQDLVYHATGISTWDLGTDDTSWIETRFTNWEVDSVRSVRVENEKGAYEIVRNEAEKPTETSTEGTPPLDPKPTPAPVAKWKIASPADAATQALDESKTDTFVGGFGRLYLGEVLGPTGTVDATALGLVTPTATVTVTMKDGSTHVLKLGHKREKESDHALAESGGTHVVTLRSYAADDHFRKALSDLQTVVTPEAPKSPEPPAPPEDQ